MVVIDQEPLRKRTTSECSEARSRLDAARAGWHRFEREDKPAFNRWRARAFGSLLSKAREVENEIRERQSLIHEVEMEMRRVFQDAQTAYQRVMFRRENPTAADEARNEKAAVSADGRVLTDFEKEALFQEWVQKSLGTNPDKMDDEAYTTTFEAFKAHMFRMPRDEPRAQNKERGGTGSQRPPPAAAEMPAEPESAPRPVDARVKELYRRLVRRLHPDLRADGSAFVNALWHEVQEAYAAGDVARMEILLALSEIESDDTRDETSLSQLRKVLAEMKRAFRALEKSLLEAEREDAWNFARSGANEELRNRVQRGLQSELANRVERLRLLTKTIDAWARGSKGNRKVGMF